MNISLLFAGVIIRAENSFIFASVFIFWFLFNHDDSNKKNIFFLCKQNIGLLLLGDFQVFF